METNKLMTKKGIFFLLIFSLLAFVGDKINFSKLIGAESQFFTLFQFFGPIAGAFLGPVVGVLSVLIAEISSKLANHASWDLVSILRLTPMLFAAWYFGAKKDRLSIAVPTLAIIAFIVHPVGRQVWYFSLFWTIPILLKITSEKYAGYIVNGVLAAMLIFILALNSNLLAIGSAILAVILFNLFPKITSKSIGATFTAHAVGGAIWNYVVPMTPEAWIALIPIVIFERMIFTSGITVSFMGINTLLARLNERTKADYITIDKKHVLFKHPA